MVTSSTAYAGGQISQQQVIYDQVINLAAGAFQFVSILCADFTESSFGTILKLHEVIEFSKPVTMFADAGAEVPR